MTDKIITRLTVHIQPNASRNKLIDFKDGVLRVKITALPVDGKANQELVRYLSICLGIRKSDVNIVRGLTGRDKIVTVYGIGQAQITRKITDLLSHNS